MSAEELFEAKGYDATSIDDIAYRTGISKSTLYVYFKSKQLIWDHIVCKYMEQLWRLRRRPLKARGALRNVTISSVLI